MDHPATSLIRSMPRCSVTSRCWATTLSYPVTRGNRVRSKGGGVLLGEEETAAPKWFGMTMKYFDGSSARSGPVSQNATSDGVAVNHVGETTTLSFAPLSSPSVE